MKTKEQQKEALKNLILEGENTLNVLELTPELFEGNEFILLTFFNYKNHSLNYFHFNEDLFIEKYNTLNMLYGNTDSPKYNPLNDNYQTATYYQKDKLRKKWIELIIKMTYFENENIYFNISFEGYNSNDKYFEYSNRLESIEYAEYDEFRENDSNNRLNRHTKDEYDELPSHMVNYADLYLLKELCKDLIKINCAMIFNVSSYMATVNKLEAVELCYKADNDLLKAQLKKLEREIEELGEWLKEGNNDITLYLKDEYLDSEMTSIYIDTYHTCIGMYEGFAIFNEEDPLDMHTEIQNTIFYEYLKQHLYKIYDQMTTKYILEQIYTRAIYDNNYSYIENADWKGNKQEDDEYEEYDYECCDNEYELATLED